MKPRLIYPAIGWEDKAEARGISRKAIQQLWFCSKIRKHALEAKSEPERIFFNRATDQLWIADDHPASGPAKFVSSPQPNVAKIEAAKASKLQ
jgi:hypothetical protein